MTVVQASAREGRGGEDAVDAQPEVAPPARPEGRVCLSLPADPAFLSVLRTTSAALAARCDLTLDEVEDLRIAVTEAASLLLVGSRGGDVLEVVYDAAPHRLAVEIHGPADHLPAADSVAWAVLRALAGRVRSSSGPDGSVVSLDRGDLLRSGDDGYGDGEARP